MRYILSAAEVAKSGRFEYWPVAPNENPSIAEIELSVMTRQCLDRRIGEADELDQQLHAWNDSRNKERCGLNWHFTTADARITLRHLYPLV